MAEWQAGSIKPITGRLVWKDDSMAGPQFLAASPKDAAIAAAFLNELETKLAEALAELKLWRDDLERNATRARDVSEVK